MADEIRKDIIISVQTDTSQASEGISELQNQISDIQDVSIPVNVDTEGLTQLQSSVQNVKQALIDFQNTGGANVTQLEDAFAGLVTEAGGLEQALDQLKDIEGFDEFNKGVEEGIGLLQKFGNDVPVEEFTNFKTQIKEARLEAERLAVQFGTNSQEFLTAAQNVAELEDNYGDFRTTIESFNPDNRLQALTSAARGAVGAIQGVQGAMTFLGVESETAQESIAKLQALMAFSNALNSVEDIKKGFSDFGKVIKNVNIAQSANNALIKINAVSTNLASKAFRAFGVSVNATSTAFKVLKGAIISTGIGALIVGVGLLVEKIVEWTSSTSDAEEAQKKLEASEAALRKRIEDTNTEYKNRQSILQFLENLAIAEANARGASLQEIRNLEDQYYQENYAAANTAYSDQEDLLKKFLDEQLAKQGKSNDERATLVRNYYNQAIFDAEAFYNKLSEGDKKLYDELNSNVENADKERVGIFRGQEIREANRREQDRKKREQDAKEAAAEAKRVAQELTKEQLEAIDIRFQNLIKKELENERERSNFRKQQIKETVTDERERNVLIAQENERFAAEQKIIAARLEKEKQDEIARVAFEAEKKRISQEEKNPKLRAAKLKNLEDKFNLERLNRTQKLFDDIAEIETNAGDKSLEIRQQTDEQILTEQFNTNKEILEKSITNDRDRAIALKALEIQFQRDLSNIQLEGLKNRQIQEEEIRFRTELAKAQNITDEKERKQAIENVETQHQLNLETINITAKEKKKEVDEKYATDEKELVKQTNADIFLDTQEFYNKLVDDNNNPYKKRKQALEEFVAKSKELFEQGKITEDEYNQVVEDSSEKRKSLLLEELAFRQEQFDLLNDLLGNLTSLFNKGDQDDKKSKKRAARLEGVKTIGNIAIATTEKVIKAAPNVPLQVAYAAAGAAGIAATIKNTSKTIKELDAIVPGGDSGGGGITPGTTAPNIQATATQPQEIQNVRVTNQPGDQVIRAYITDRDLRNNESRTRFLNQLSTF